MTNKTQLVNIQKYLMGQPIDIINDDDGEYYLSTESALELAQQILDMGDKAQLDRINEILLSISDSDDTLGFHERNRLAHKILDICQPKWIPVTERLPDAEPHRTIEIACISPYPDDEKSPYSIHVSTRLPVTAFEGVYSWREVVLPLPEDKI